MSEEALRGCVHRHLEHAAIVSMLDDELGTHHGLSWADFVLLTVLDAAGGAAPAIELAQTSSWRSPFVYVVGAPAISSVVRSHLPATVE